MRCALSPANRKHSDDTGDAERCEPPEMRRVRFEPLPAVFEAKGDEAVKRSTDRMLSSHIGSLPRTAEALAVLQARNSGGDVAREVFESTILAAVTETVRRQVDVGLTVVNDGEQSKWAYMASVRDRLDGFEVRSLPAADSGPTAPGLAAEAADFPICQDHRLWNG
jgi:hypothetical protein